jgi:hypothetical protein
LITRPIAPRVNIAWFGGSEVFAPRLAMNSQAPPSNEIRALEHILHGDVGLKLWRHSLCATFVNE